MTLLTTLLTTMLTVIIEPVIAGISWEPEIRGALTVALASAVLMGSIWGILVTNTGVRLGSLIALAGFFSWMMLMGIFWWIYGIGYVGNLPTWEVKEINYDMPGSESGGVADAAIGNVGLLPDVNCQPGADTFPPNLSTAGGLQTGPNCTARAIDILAAYPGPEREQVMQELLNPQIDENKIGYIADVDGITDRDAIFAELLKRNETELRSGVEIRNATLDETDSRFQSAAELNESVADLVARRDTRINQLTLSALAAIGPDVIDWAIEEDHVDLRGWNLLSTAQSGEAVATAEGVLNEEAVFGGEREFIVLDSFQQGGKPKRVNDDMFSRVWHKITSTARITHPTNYAVVQTQVTKAKEALPGQLPPLPEPDPEGSVVSVIMTRNLGNLRLVPALLALASGLLFLATCLALHLRDLELRRRLAGAAT